MIAQSSGSLLPWKVQPLKEETEQFTVYVCLPDKFLKERRMFARPGIVSHSEYA